MLEHPGRDVAQRRIERLAQANHAEACGEASPVKLDIGPREQAGAVRLKGFLQPAEGFQGDGKIRARLVKTRIQGDGALEARHRLDRPSESELRAPDPADRIGEIRAERERALERIARLLELAQVKPHVAEIAVQLRDAWIELRRAAQVPGGAGSATQVAQRVRQVAG